MQQLSSATSPSFGPMVSPGQLTLWKLFDLTLASLAILLSSDAINRFGVATPLWWLVYVMTIGRMLINWRRATAAIGNNWVFFLYPAICIFSAVWSESRPVTLTAGFQLGFSVLIAIVIGSIYSIRELIFVVLNVILLTALLSLLNLYTGVFGNVYAGSGGLLGIYTQKNALGQRSLIAILAAFALILSGRWRDPWSRAYVFASMLVLILTVSLSRSVTSILLVFPTIALCFVLCFRYYSRFLLLITSMTFVFAIAILPLLLAVFDIDVVSLVLAEFGKDATLTGRTSLWDIAGLTLADYFWSGVGFFAFWRAEKFSALVYLVQSIGGETALGFHNFILEVLVGTGFFGLLAMLILLATALVRAVVLYIRTLNVEAAFAIVAIVVSIGLAMLGPSLYRQHEFSLMFIIMLGVASGRALATRRSA